MLLLYTLDHDNDTEKTKALCKLERCLVIMHKATDVNEMALFSPIERRTEASRVRVRELLGQGKSLGVLHGQCRTRRLLDADTLIDTVTQDQAWLSCSIVIYFSDIS